MADTITSTKNKLSIPVIYTTPSSLNNMHKLLFSSVKRSTFLFANSSDLVTNILKSCIDIGFVFCSSASSLLQNMFVQTITFPRLPITLQISFTVIIQFSFSSFFYTLHSHTPYGLNHYTQQQTLSLFHTCIESILHKLNGNLNIFCYNLYRVLSFSYPLQYNIINIIAVNIPIISFILITIVLNLKITKNSNNTRTKTLINTNFLIIFHLPLIRIINTL